MPLRHSLTIPPIPLLILPGLLSCAQARTPGPRSETVATVYFTCTVADGTRRITLAAPSLETLELRTPDLVVTSDPAGIYVEDDRGPGRPFAISLGLSAPNTSMRYSIWLSEQRGEAGGTEAGYKALSGDVTSEDLLCDQGSLHHDVEALLRLIDLAQISP